MDEHLNDLITVYGGESILVNVEEAKLGDPHIVEGVTIGHFISNKDEDGYAIVSLSSPQEIERVVRRRYEVLQRKRMGVFKEFLEKYKSYFPNLLLVAADCMEENGFMPIAELFREIVETYED